MGGGFPLSDYEYIIISTALNIGETNMLVATDILQFQLQCLHGPFSSAETSLEEQ